MDFLESIRSRPGLFWGGGPYPFTSLVAFLAGYKIAFDITTRTGIAPTSLLPEGFNSFVGEQLGLGSQIGGHDWASLIREKTASEEEAFDLFFQLRIRYESEN